MSKENNHDASGQLSGYLYQVLAALLLLIKNKEPEAQVCIEKFDDVAFVEEDRPQVMIQTKHQLYKKGNLNDTSVDLWRTIKSWCDSIVSGVVVIEETEFIILTTASAKEDAAAYYLAKTQYRDEKKAIAILSDIAKNDTVKANAAYYEAFLALGKDNIEKLVKHICVYDNSSSIIDIKEDIMPYIRFATLPAHEENVYEKIVGWWINNVIKCLGSEDPVYINRRQLQQEIYDIGSQYKADSLPIDIDPYYEPTEEELQTLLPENRIFIEQLKLIELSSDSLKRCIRDYYNAHYQRSRWVRENLLYINEFTKYEEALVDEWKRCYDIMKEELEDYGSKIEEKQKVLAGRKLFRKVEEFDSPIRKNVSQPFNMRGTYQGLANRLTVGWHIEFMERLCCLLKE